MTNNLKSISEAESTESGYYLVNEDFQEGESHSVLKLHNGNNLSKTCSYKSRDRILKPSSEQWVPAANFLFPNLREKIIPSETEKSDTYSKNISCRQTHNLDKIPENFDMESSSPEDFEIAQCLILSAAEKLALDKLANELPQSLQLPQLHQPPQSPQPPQPKAASDTIDPCPDNSWYVIYGDDYEPVVLNNIEYNELRENLRDETYVPTKTFISARSKSQLKIIYDEDNRFKSVTYMPKTTPRNQCKYLGKSLSLACIPGEREKQIPCQCDSQLSSIAVCNDLKTQIECLKRKNDELQLKIDSINAGKCCVRKQFQVDGRKSESNLVFYGDLLKAQKKIADLQCELRDLNCEIRRINEDQFFIEMKCSQHERRNKSLQSELDHSAKIEKDLKCCLESMEKEVEKEKLKHAFCRTKLAKICHILQMDCKMSIEEILQLDTSEIQCQLEKAAVECVKNCQCYQKSLKEAQCNTKVLEDKLACLNTKYEEECLKAQRLQDQLLAYQEDLQSSVTDLSCRIKSRENELCKTQNRLQELTKKYSHHEIANKCKDLEIKHLKDQIGQLETDRDQYVERLRSKKCAYKTKLVGLRDKYKQRLKNLLDKQVQVCYAKSNESIEDKNQIAMKKMEVICSEAINRMQDIQNRLHCSSSSETELKQRIDDLNNKLECVKGLYPLHQSIKCEKLTQTNRSTLPHSLLMCPNDVYTPRPLTPRLPRFVVEKPIVSCRLETSDSQLPDIQQEIKRAQQWASKILSQEPCCGQVTRQDPLCSQKSHQCTDHYQFPTKSKQNCPFVDGHITALPITDNGLQFRPPFLLSCPILPQNSPYGCK